MACTAQWLEGASKLGFYRKVYRLKDFRKLSKVQSTDIDQTIFEYLGGSFIFDVQGPR